MILGFSVYYVAIVFVVPLYEKQQLLFFCLKLDLFGYFRLPYFYKQIIITRLFVPLVSQNSTGTRRHHASKLGCSRLTI